MNQCPINDQRKIIDNYKKKENDSLIREPVESKKHPENNIGDLKYGVGTKTENHRVTIKKRIMEIMYEKNTSG